MLGMSNIMRRLVFNRKLSAHFFSSLNDKEVLFERLTGEHEGIASIGFNRASVKNAIGLRLVNDFKGAIKEAKSDKSIRVIILRSLVPGYFSIGADLKEQTNMELEEAKEFITNSMSLLELENLPMPVLAAIDGLAFGGGLEIALGCDIRIAADTARMGLVETGLAVIPGGGGTQRLPRLIGPAKAKELIFTASLIDGNEAKEAGIVTYVVPQNESGDAAYKRSLELAKKITPNGPLAIKMAKMAINKGLQVDLDAGLTLEQNCYAQIIPSKDRLEGLKAFKEKRKPIYTGE